MATSRSTRQDTRGAVEGQCGSLPAGRGRESHPVEAGLVDPGSAGGGWLPAVAAAPVGERRWGGSRAAAGSGGPCWGALPASSEALRRPVSWPRQAIGRNGRVTPRRPAPLQRGGRDGGWEAVHAGRLSPAPPTYPLTPRNPSPSVQYLVVTVSLRTSLPLVRIGKLRPVCILTCLSDIGYSGVRVTLAFVLLACVFPQVSNRWGFFPFLLDSDLDCPA